MFKGLYVGGRWWVELSYCQIRLDHCLDIVVISMVAELTRAVNHSTGKFIRN